MSPLIADWSGPIPVPDPGMPLDQYLDAACLQNAELRESQHSTECFVSPLFGFLRYVRAYPSLKDVSAKEALTAVEKWLSAKNYPDLEEAWVSEFPRVNSLEDARVEFLDVWDQVKFPAGCSPIEVAMREAKKSKLRFPGCPTPGFEKFLVLAAYLQGLRPGQTIMLPCRLVAEHLGCTPNTVSSYRDWAIRKGFLKVAKPHSFGARKATEFEFDLRRVPPGAIQ